MVDVLGCAAGAYGTGYLTGGVAAGRENYYSGAVAQGEPPGRWYGTGAARLGLAGEVSAEDMTRLYDQLLDPRDETGRTHLGKRPARYATAEERLAQALEREPMATPERVAELRLQAERATPTARAFWDMTFSVAKSVTVLHTAFEAQEVAAQRAGDLQSAAVWREHRLAVEEAIWAGNLAAMDYIADEAGYARAGFNGIRRVDAHDLTVASFFQHTNRENEPQLHIHNAILNRVECADGKFRTLDGKQLIAQRPAASAIADRTMEEHLSASLGVRFATRPDGKAREVVGISSAVTDLFSERRRQVSGKLAELVADHAARFGKPPNALQLDRLAQQATLATRRAKSHVAETRAEQIDRWETQLRAEVDAGMEDVARSVLGRAGVAEAEQFSPSAVVATALADVQASRSVWGRADLVRAVNDALPDCLGGLTGAQVRELVTGLTDAALQVAGSARGAEPGGSVTAGGAVSLTYDLATDVAADFQLADGRSAYSNPSGPKFATRGHLLAEQRLRSATVARGAASVSAVDAGRWVAGSGRTLSADQEAAVRGVLTSGARVECLVGPAGTGKSYVVGTLAEAWPDLTGGRVFGLAASQIATEVLAEDGVTARNITRWLGSLDRLADGTASREDARFRLSAADLVIVDESGMADRESLSRIHAHVEAAGAKLLTTGDHRQLAAVGAGGTFAMLTETAQTYELAEVRRFSAGWEREASLRLREGDASSLLEYQKRGRLVDGGTVERAGEAATRAYLGDYLAGHRSLLIVETNEQAAQLSGRVRDRLVELGRVEERGVLLGLQGTYAGAGDLVQARLNARSLAGFEGNQRGPVNREMYRVTETRPDGSIVVKPADDDQAPEMVLPAAYVRDHLALGYATTVYGAQGQTVYSGHAVVSSSTELSSLYPAMTRGTDSNTAYVATIRVDPTAPAGSDNGVERRSPAAVLADCLDRAEAERAALIEAELSLADARSIASIGARLADAVEVATAGRAAAMFDRLTDLGVLTLGQRQQIACDDANSPLSRLLRTAELAGHDVEQVVAEAIQSRPLDGADSVAQVIHWRVAGDLHGQLAPAGDSFVERVPAGLSADHTAMLTRLAELADDRRRELGFEVATKAPQWAVEALGQVPADLVDRAEWEHRAGLVAAARELTRHDAEDLALGPAPRLHDTEDRAVWHAAWRALGRPEADREEAELSEGQLRVRIRAYERELTWAPNYVADELEEASRQAASAEQEAAVRRAEGRLDLAAELEARAAEACERAQSLEAVDAARTEWLAETQATRTAAMRAREELVERVGEDVGQEPDRVTAEEWLDEEARARIEDDEHRDITAEDIAEASKSDEERSARDKAAEEKSAQDKAAEAVARAQEALERIEGRRAEEAAHRADEEANRAEEARRAEELARWEAEERAAAERRNAAADDDALSLT